MLFYFHAFIFSLPFVVTTIGINFLEKRVEEKTARLNLTLKTLNTWTACFLFTSFLWLI